MLPSSPYKEHFLARALNEFIKAAIRNPLEVSTVFPTSGPLARTLLSHADIERSERIVELGTGTGAITKYLAPRLAVPANYVGVELDPQMVEFMRREYPKLRFESGYADNIGAWAAEASVDVVVSSLPWTVFNDEIQQKTIDAILHVLKPGGVFLTYVCANALVYPQARAFTGRLRAAFRDVHRSNLEWRNIPPAFVYKSVK